MARRVLCEEIREFGGGQFAGRHDELAMTQLAEARNMAVDLDVVRRVRESRRRALGAHERAIIGFVARIAAERSVAAQEPEVASAADRRT